MSFILSQESRVMLAELLATQKEDTRVWLQAEMDRLVNPMLDSIFNRLETKLTNGLERNQSSDSNAQLVSLNPNFHDQSVNVQMHQPSTSSSSFNTTSFHFNQQFVSMNNSYHQPNGKNHLYSISNQQLSNLSSYATVSNEQSSHNLIPEQHSNNIDERANCQINLSDTEMQYQTRQIAATNEGVEDQIEESSSLPVKRSRLDTTQPNSAIGEESIDNESTIKPIQLNLVQSNRILQCPHCSKSFDRRSRLQRHLRVHTGERPFQCNQCDKQFSQLDNLTRHQLIHQNVKQFQCTQCERQFTLKHHLRDHLLIHSGGRPFECRHCEKSFSTSEARTKHEQAKHLHVKPYRCKECGMTVTQRATIISHIRAVHFGLPRTIKKQQALNIVDNRDPRELIEKV